MRGSANVIDLRDAWLPLVLTAAALFGGAAGAWLVVMHGWRRSLGAALLWIAIFLVLTR